MDAEMDTQAESGGVDEASTSGGSPPPYHQHPCQQPQGPADRGHRPSVGDLLAQARQLVHEGKPSLALQMVVMAVKTEGGETAVFQVLNRVREHYRSRLQANTTADDLASLFAKCAIAEVQPSGTESPPFNMDSAAMLPKIHEASILAESGRKQIVLDAFLDGSSFVCLQCGGLVSNLRKEEHFAYWCGGQI